MNFAPWIRAARLERECRAYYMAKDRCTNPKNKDYADYGGRGIKFELTSFKLLMEILGPKPEGYYLDRIDNNGPYKLDNVKWSSPIESASNRRAPPLPSTGIPGLYARDNGFVVNKDGKYDSFHQTLQSAKEEHAKG